VKAKFIVLEGIDGAGKGTQIELLAKRLRASGKRFSLVSSPRYQWPTGQLVKRALYGEFGDFVGLNGYLSALPYLLDFALQRSDLEAALKKGMVISDRYVYSTLAFQGAKVAPKEKKSFIAFVETLMFKQFKLPKPERVIYFDVPVSQAQKNMRGKKKDQHEKSVAYQKKVAQTYRELAKRKEWRTIPCMKNGRMLSPEEIHGLVWKAVQ
jgi:dTMP kinase